jgi:WD40 repeat protein
VTYSTETPKLVATLETHSWSVFASSFSADGRWLAVATRENAGVAVIDTSTWKITARLPEPNFPPSSLEFSPDQTMLLLGCCQQEPLRCWDIGSRRLLWSLPKCGQHATFSPDSKTIATNKSKTLLICDARTGRILFESSGTHRSRIDFTTYSRDGLRIASAGKSQVLFSNAATADCIAIVQEKNGTVTNLKFSPCGRYFATTSQDHHVRLYDAVSAKRLSVLAGHEDMVWALEFTADGSTLLTAGFDHKIRAWDTAGGKQIQEIDLPEGISTDHCPLSPNDELVAVPMGLPQHKVRLINWRANKTVWDLNAHVFIDPNALVKVPASPTRVSFSPNGRFLCSLWDDGQTRVWDLDGT